MNGKDHDRNMQELTEALLQSYDSEGGINHLHGQSIPSRDAVIAITREIEALLFPGFLREEHLSAMNLRFHTGLRLVHVYEELMREVERNVQFDRQTHADAASQAETGEQADAIVREFFATIPALRNVLSTDVEALFEGDPAARSREEIILSYPGLRAISVHRVAHYLWTHGARLIARMMSEYIHSRTGIDIHPGAAIGRYFYIDHGTGVVIGETTTIGEHVKVYQGVSLGALSVRKECAEMKRHPTIEDRVTIYAGATILGGETVIGHDAVIGGNVWLVRSVEPHAIVTSEAQIKVIPPEQRDQFWSYVI